MEPVGTLWALGSEEEEEEEEEGGGGGRSDEALVSFQQQAMWEGCWCT